MDGVADRCQGAWQDMFKDEVQLLESHEQLMKVEGGTK